VPIADVHRAPKTEAVHPPPPFPVRGWGCDRPRFLHRPAPGKWDDLAAEKSLSGPARNSTVCAHSRPVAKRAAGFSAIRSRNSAVSHPHPATSALRIGDLRCPVPARAEPYSLGQDA
jgi:hypothetical protein